MIMEFKNTEVRQQKINICILMSYRFKRKLQRKMKILLKAKKTQIEKIKSNLKKLYNLPTKSALSI